MSEHKTQWYERRVEKRRKRVRRLKVLIIGMSTVILVLVIYLIICLVSFIGESIEYQGGAGDVGQIIYDAVRGQEEKDEIPEDLMELMEKNPETEEFVLQYPSKKGTYSTADLDEYLNSAQVPLFLQWDSRWGYYEYGGNVMGLTGCGPTCLSMVAIHVLQNPELTPIYMANYAQRNGYYADGIGTSWDFMSQGARALGLNVSEVPLTEGVVKQYLENGNPIIAIMGPGDFTESGHFIVFVGVKDGKIIVNDPNSKSRSQQLWEFEDIKYQIKNMWVYSN